MTAIEQIQAAQRDRLVNEDGETVSLELLPPLAPDKISCLESRIGVPLPKDLCELIGFCSGIEGFLEQIDFSGENLSFEMSEIFPHGLPIASDGCGNFWVLDITSETKSTAPVFFACHDAPVMLYQSPDLATFLAEVFRMFTPPHKSLVNDVHDDRLFNVWRQNPGVMEHATALASSDPTLREFAVKLPDNFQLVDMRTASPGMGFSWGRYGPNTRVLRHGGERIFAYAKPIKAGFLARLFGR